MLDRSPGAPTTAVRLRHEWLQKHPSPRSASGDFHWYPGTLDADLRADLAAAARTGGQAVWRIAPGRVTWAVSFADVAPADRRRYVGLAVTSAVADAPAAALLAAIAVLPPAPWCEPGPAVEREVTVTPPPPAADPPGGDAGVARDPALAAEVARALWSGGAAVVPSPTAPWWPAVIASLSSWLPDGVAATRSGALIAADPSAPAAADAPGPLHHYLARAWALPPAIAERDPDFGRRTWHAALALAGRAGRTPAQMFDDLAELARAWDTTAALTAYLDRTGAVVTADRAGLDRRGARLDDAGDAGRLWARVVHLWGRGHLAGDRLDQRLAAVLARRVLADHLLHLDAPDQPALPGRYLRRLHRECLLTRERARHLQAAVAARVPEVVRG